MKNTKHIVNPKALGASASVPSLTCRISLEHCGDFSRAQVANFTIAVANWRLLMFHGFGREKLFHAFPPTFIVIVSQGPSVTYRDQLYRNQVHVCSDCADRMSSRSLYPMCMQKQITTNPCSDRATSVFLKSFSQNLPLFSCPWAGLFSQRPPILWSWHWPFP